RYSEEGRARLDAFIAQFSEVPEPGGACVGSGMPGMMLSTVSYPIEFVQNESRILMVAELETQVRRVFIDGRAHPEEAFPTGSGHSVGTWEGDTLVIDTALLEEWPLAPWPRSENARIVERMYLTKMDDIDVQRTGFIAEVLPPLNDDVLVVDITITDPAYYDGPQRRIAYYQRMDDYATSEYACSRGLWYDELDKLRVPADVGGAPARSPLERAVDSLPTGRIERPASYDSMTAEQQRYLAGVLGGPRSAVSGPLVVMLASPALGDLAQRAMAYAR